MCNVPHFPLRSVSLEKLLYSVHLLTYFDNSFPLASRVLLCFCYLALILNPLPTFVSTLVFIALSFSRYTCAGLSSCLLFRISLFSFFYFQQGLTILSLSLSLSRLQQPTFLQSFCPCFNLGPNQHFFPCTKMLSKLWPRQLAPSIWDADMFLSRLCR